MGHFSLQFWEKFLKKLLCGVSRFILYFCLSHITRFLLWLFFFLTHTSQMVRRFILMKSTGNTAFAGLLLSQIIQNIPLFETRRLQIEHLCIIGQLQVDAIRFSLAEASGTCSVPERDNWPRVRHGWNPLFPKGSGQEAIWKSRDYLSLFMT